MKKISGLIFGLLLSHNAYAADMADIVKNVKDVCLTPSQQGKYWNVTATGGAKADGTIKLVAAGINGQATFSKAEWQGVQQALQPKENADYRDCVERLTPLFIGKFSASAPAVKASPKATAKPAAKTSANPAKSSTAAKTAATPPAKTAATEPDAEVNVETHGEKSPAINGDNATVNYGK